VNGVPIDSQHLRRVSAYVEQEDALIGSLTVSETLDFAVQLSTPHTTKTERLARIDTLLAAFGLTDLANNLIGTTTRKGISGGQKRRVSVAAQLVTGPRLLFLDEPTSGLDSAAAFEVISYLRSAAQKYRVGRPVHVPGSSKVY
jgi:ABC-type multidrug transport system ATPase subunit